MLVLEGKGAAADAAAFRAAGIGDFDVFDFEREAKRPDGTPVKVAFSLAFASDPKAPDTGFFTCQQHYPENFWNPAFQKHPNGVTGVAGVVLVADNPADHHVFLKGFSGVSDLKSTSSGITIETPRGEIQVMDPAAFRLHYAVDPPDVARGMRLAAIRFAGRHGGGAIRTRHRGHAADGQADRRPAGRPRRHFGVRAGIRLTHATNFSKVLTEISGFSAIVFRVRRTPFNMIELSGASVAR